MRAFIAFAVTLSAVAVLRVNDSSLLSIVENNQTWILLFLYTNQVNAGDAKKIQILESKFQNAFNECQAKLNGGIIPNSEECMVACAGETIGLVSWKRIEHRNERGWLNKKFCERSQIENKKISLQRLQKFADMFPNQPDLADSLQNVYDTCKTVTNDDPCEAGNEVMHCVGDALEAAVGPNLPTWSLFGDAVFTPEIEYYFLSINNFLNLDLNCNLYHHGYFRLYSYGTTNIHLCLSHFWFVQIVFSLFGDVLW